MSDRRSLNSCLLAGALGSRMLLGWAIAIVALSLSATSVAQLDTRHYLPPMPAFADSDLQIVVSTPATDPVPFVLRSRLSGNDLILQQGTVVQGSPFNFTIARNSSSENAAGLIGHTLASAATPLDDYGLVLEADAAVSMTVSILRTNNRDIFSSKGGNGLGTEFYAWSHYNTTGNSIDTSNNDSGHFVSVMAIHDDTIVTVEGPDQFFGFDLSSGSQSVSLNQYQSLVLLTSQNLTITGTRISSTQPVSVISGDLHPAQTGSSAKDSAIDNLVPTNLAGNEFVVANLFAATSFGNPDTNGVVGVGNRYVQLVSVTDNSEVTQYAANGDEVRVILFDNAGEVKTYHLPGTEDTGYFFRSTSSIPGYQANDFLMYWNSSADAGTEMSGTQLPALRSVNSQGSFCSGNNRVEYTVPLGPTSFFVYVPEEELSSLEVDNGDGAGFRAFNDASLAVAAVTDIGVEGGLFAQISLVRYGSTFATAGSRVAFRAPRRIHAGIGAAPTAVSSLGFFSDYSYAFQVLDPDYDLTTSGYPVPASSPNNQPATVHHCIKVDSVCSSSFRISAISTTNATAVNLAADLVGPDAICFDFTPDRVVGAGTRSYATPVTIMDNGGNGRSVEVRFEYTFTDEAQPLSLTIPDGQVDVVTLLSADSNVQEWGIAGGEDAAQFTIDANGRLQFNNPPNFHDPQDADGDNVYEVVVELETTDSSVYEQPVFVTVTTLFNDRFEL